MTPTPEQIAAFADGQLEGAEQAQVGAAVAADPALARQVEAHRALARRLGAHFAPIAAEPVPDHLAAMLAAPKVVDLAEARARRKGPPRWAWVAGPALAASLVLAVSLGQRSSDYVSDDVALALDRQLTSEQAGAATVRVLLSFRDGDGSFCRAYAASGASGIACRDDEGWKLQAAGQGEAQSGTEYRQAGSEGAIMARAQAMAAGPALDAAEERAARDGGWRKAGS
ncbi:hypothetical protein [Novosphingobium sp. B1]|uniref:hypothetical protein n=1 Tax=Novosphingobium sp. B1 TaxID=1938756 RepID=UPI0009D7CC90|nr:hypothetical protein [Novosphingobium sp. B1]SMC93088.1 hypothetical protein SAMN06272759_11220 [Novosphingobium sp. B1]